MPSRDDLKERLYGKSLGSGKDSAESSSEGQGEARKTPIGGSAKAKERRQNAYGEGPHSDDSWSRYPVEVKVVNNKKLTYRFIDAVMSKPAR